MTENIALADQHRFWLAASNGDCETIRLLAMKGVDIEARNSEGYTAFNLATKNGHSKAAWTLLAAKEMQFARRLGVDPAEFYKLPENNQKSSKKKTA